MKNSFGQSVTLTIFGESHGPAVGAVIDGLAPGMVVDEERIAAELSRRRPDGATDTARKEEDRFSILSGVFQGKTTGTPVTIVIPNENTKSGDYAYGLARPSHADYAAYCKYHGYEDYRGGGHFSGRVTAGLVAAGGILLPALEQLGITVGTHILSAAGVSDRALTPTPEELTALKNKKFPVLDEQAGERMIKKIAEAREKGDSVGGRTETAVCGLMPGLGEPWFDSVESLLSHALFSLGGVKGVAFGEGFGFADLTGSAANDPLRVEDGRIITETNRNGGINGGITNGMPVIFSCAVKPTPSIAIPQETVDFTKNENADIAVKGRHDPAIIRRICPVIDSVTTLVLCDLLAQRFGTDFLAGGKR